MPVFYPDTGRARLFKLELPKDVPKERFCYHLRIGYDLYNAMKVHILVIYQVFADLYDS